MSGIYSLLSAMERGASSTSSHQGESGGGGHVEEMVGVGEGGPEPGPIRGPESIASTLDMMADSTTLKSFLRECHVAPAVIMAIPDMFGLGMFVSLSREDINELSEDRGIQMLLRTAQTLINKQLERLQSAPPAMQPAPRVPVREHAGGGGLVMPVPQQANPVPEPMVAARDNADPYLVSQSVDTFTGKQCMYAMYGQHEGGVPTVLARLPSTIKGSCAPKGQFSLHIPDLGVNLVSNVADNKALRIRYWHSYLMIGDYANFIDQGTDQWSVDTAHFYAIMFEGLSLEVYNRTPSQMNCSHMFEYQETAAFQNPRCLLRLLTGKFRPGENGVQIESFEKSKGASRSDCDEPDLLGRNKGIIECLESLEAFIRTFINKTFPDAFGPIKNLLRVSEFLHRTSSKILLKYLNVCYGVVFNALSNATNVKTVAHSDPVSIKGIGLFGQTLSDISIFMVGILSSRVSLKAMVDDFSGRQAEDELRLKMINKFQNMGDLNLASPTKKRPTDTKIEELSNSKRDKEKERKRRRKEELKNAASSKDISSPALAGVKVKSEPTSGAKGGSEPPVVKRESPCMYHIALKLNLKDPNQVLYKCPHGMEKCRYRHLALKATRRDKAEIAAKNCGDQTLKALLLTGIASSTDFL